MRQTIKLTICIAALFCVTPAYADTVNTGTQAYQSGEYSRALDILMSLENQDHPAAQNLIGNAFNTGSGVKQSNEIAARWWTKAADQNYAPAQVSLSYLYFTGNGVKTTYNDRRPFIVPNSVQEIQNQDGSLSYVENTVAVDQEHIDDYYRADAVDGDYLIDKSYVKLREVVLGYQLPKKMIENTPLSSLSISVFGRNLLVWRPADNQFVDPEVTTFGNGIEADFVMIKHIVLFLY